MMDLRDRLRGVLLGTAIGDALGLPFEGMSAAAIARRAAPLDRYRLFGARGFVSDDTEQSALVAQSLARHPRARAECVRALERSLLGWFARLPWGIGWGTLRACVRIALRMNRTGVASAGNGAAMRSAIVGAFFFDDPATRRSFADAFARVTHVDARAVEGARFVAELAAHAVRASADDDRDGLVATARGAVEEPSLGRAIDDARALARDGASVDIAVRTLGSSGFVVHSVAIAAYAFARFGDDPSRAIANVIRAGGDTDTNAAIVGSWVGALHGERGLPARLVADLHDRDPFAGAGRTLAGPSHLRALADDLARARSVGEAASARAEFAWPSALLRNALLYPIVLAHGLAVLVRR